MTIDPTTPEKYRLRRGDKIAAIYANPDGSLFVVYVRRLGTHAGMCVNPDGRFDPGCDGEYDIIPHDPVVRYWSVYPDGSVFGNDRFDTTHSQLSPGAVHRYAYHASGKVRPIPLDATTDPEATHE